MHGRFITFEGGEGSGKSTQARLLADHLRAGGHRVVETREPGGSPFAERVRGLLLDPTMPAHVPLAAALMFTAARADHLAATIRPALARGEWVICDRFTDSTRVYQGSAGGIDGATLEALERLVVGETQPGLTLLLDLDPATGLSRARLRGAGAAADGYEARGLTYHERLRAGFLALAASEPMRIVVLDGALPVATLAEKVREVVAARLGGAR